MPNRHLTLYHLIRILACVLPLSLVLPLALSLALLWATAASAQVDGAPPPLDVTTVPERVDLLPHIAYLRDPGGQLTAAEVAAPANAARFVAAGDSSPNLGITGDAIWVRFTLANGGTEPLPLVLNVDTPSTALLDLYEEPVAPGAAPKFATGARRPYDTRPIEGRTFAFPLEAPPGGAKSYYLRLQSDLLNRLVLELWQPRAFQAHLDGDEIWWGIVLGMLLLMSAYNLLLFLALRDGKHLVLTLFGTLVAVSSAFAGGYAARWLSPALSAWSPLLVILSIAAVITAFALLAFVFLDLRRRLRPAWWIIVAALGGVGVAVLLAFAGQYATAFVLAVGAMLPILLTMFVATLIRVRQGSRIAVFLLLSQAIPMVFGVFQSASILGIGPRWPALPLVVPVNSLLLLVLMSLALADRIHLLRREADAANAALVASEQRLNTYLDALPFRIQVHDPSLKPLYVNAAIRQSRPAQRDGWYEEQYDTWLREFPVLRSGAGEPYPLEQLPLIRAAKGETAHADDIALRMPGGEVAIEAWAVPLRDEGGQVTAIVTAFQDITARRAVETELANYRETLEQRVSQRTGELAALNASLTARVAELTAINEVGRRAVRIVDMEATLDEVTRIALDVFGAAGAVIGLYHEEEPLVQIVAAAARDAAPLAQFVGQSYPFAIDRSYAGRHQNPTVFRAPEELAGLPPELQAGIQRLGIAHVLVAPLVTRDQHMGALALFSADPARTFSADELRVAQTIAGQVATAIDTARLIDEVRRQRDVAEALGRTATALSRNLDQQNVLGAILEQLDQVFACEGAAVALVEGSELVTVAAKGLSEGRIGRRTALDGEGAGLAVLRTRRPLVVEDTQAPPTPPDGEGADLAVLHSRPLVGEDTQARPTTPGDGSVQAAGSWLGAPLVSGEHAIGVLSLDRVRAGRFSAQEADLLATFADQAAVAVVNARLYTQAQELAVANERGRLARDLHDAVTQTIFSASLIAAALPARLGETLPPAARADLDALQVLTKGALAEMRTLLLELRPEHLAEVRLELLLTQLAQAFSGRTGVPASVDAAGADAAGDPNGALPHAVKLAFYRVAQEALNNIGKHAQATCVTIRFSSRRGAARLAVIDDGRGFDVEQVGAERLGLAIMRERAAAAGAQLTVDSEPGLGTHIFMVWNDDNDTQTT